MKKRLISVLVMVSLLFPRVMVSAADTEATTVRTYQDAIDELNDEYGTDVHFMTEEELAVISQYVIGEFAYPSEDQLSVDEFKEALRADIIADKEAEMRANEIQKSRVNLQNSEQGGGTCESYIILDGGSK